MASCSSAAAASELAQYVVVRADLLKKLGWNVGSVVAQAVHASVAGVHLHRDEEDTRRYLADLDRMTTVVLEVPNESGLRKLSDKLGKAAVDHKLWVEQPEDYPTCLATRPYPKDQVRHLFKKCQLFRGPPLAVKAPAPPAEEEPTADGSGAA